MNRYHGQGQRTSRPPPPGLTTDYLKRGYFDGKGNLWPELVVEEAQRVARSLNRGGQLKTTQLRRFFRKARGIQRKLDAGQSFAALVAELKALQPLAANSVARGNAPPVFKEFIDRNVPLASRDAKHFVSGFLMHFQSIVCYFAYLTPR